MTNMTNVSRIRFDIRTVFIAIAIASASVFGIAVSIHQAEAAACIYQQTVGGAVGDFNTAANWIGCGGVAPGSGDNVIIASGTTTQLSAPVSVSTLNTSGTLDALVFDFTVTSSARINNGGVVTSTSGNLGFGGVNVVIGGSGGVGALGSISGNINVSGTLYIDGPTSSLDIGFGTTTLYGDFFPDLGAVINGRVGTFEFAGSNLSVGTAILNMQNAKLIFTGGAAQFLNFLVQNATAFGNIEVNKSGGTVTQSGNGTSTGSFSINRGTFDLGSTTLRVGGNFTVNGGTFTPNSGTVTLNGSGAQSVSSTAFTNFSIAKSAGTATLSSSATTTGNFSLTGGTLSLGSKEFAVGGNFIVNGGVFSPGVATTTLNGAGAQSVSSTTFGALTVNKSGGTATLTASVSTIQHIN